MSDRRLELIDEIIGLSKDAAFNVVRVNERELLEIRGHIVDLMKERDALLNTTAREIIKEYTMAPDDAEWEGAHPIIALASKADHFGEVCLERDALAKRCAVALMYQYDHGNQVHQTVEAVLVPKELGDTSTDLMKKARQYVRDNKIHDGYGRLLEDMEFRAWRVATPTEAPRAEPQQQGDAK